MSAGLEALLRWMHVLVGVLWIGHLYFFNFVNGPMAAKLDGPTKKAVVPELMPRALYWFRWGAASTVLWGLILAWMQGTLGSRLAIGLIEGDATTAMIGIAMWFGLIMAFNVWFVIWPNQKKALGMVDASADEKKAAGLNDRTEQLPECFHGTL